MLNRLLIASLNAALLFTTAIHHLGGLALGYLRVDEGLLEVYVCLHLLACESFAVEPLKLLLLLIL